MGRTRREVRKRLATLMAESNAFEAVYDHAPLDLRGQDRVVCIYSDRTRHEMLSADMNNAFYRFFLETFALRRVNERPQAGRDRRQDIADLRDRFPVVQDFPNLLDLLLRDRSPRHVLQLHPGTGKSPGCLGPIVGDVATAATIFVGA